MTGKKGLIESSRLKLGSFNLGELKEAGLEREDLKSSSHTHHIVTYPPFQALPEIGADEIYFKSEISSEKEKALYIHLPFCTGKCTYCAYVTLASQGKEFIDHYLDSVEKEINLLNQSATVANSTINSIYVGGGTPTYLSPTQLERVFALLNESFRITKDAEITVECSPETIIGKEGEKKLAILLEKGANRLNIGFQSLDDRILSFILRRHTSEDAIQSYLAARNAGFENINIDLIPGLPFQTPELWEKDLSKVEGLEPDSVTCYPLSIKKKAAMYNTYLNERHIFPSNNDVLLMNLMANIFFADLGYINNPVFWFAKDKSHVYRQQIHKWSFSGEQLALGVSAYSFINDFQYFNTSNINTYFSQLERKILPVERGIKLGREELMRRALIFGIKAELDKNEFMKRFGRYPKNVFTETWSKLERLGLIDEDNELIKLSEKGKLFVDEVSREFFNDRIKRLIEN